jgi:hypothetical protein
VAAGAVFAVLGLIGIVDGWRLVRGAKNHSRRVTTVGEVADEGAALSGYLATYLLPFLGDLPQSIGDWIAYGLYFLVAFIVYVRSNLDLVNPTLYALGYRLLRAEVDGTSKLHISRTAVSRGDEITVSGLFDVLLVHRVCQTRAP